MNLLRQQLHKTQKVIALEKLYTFIVLQKDGQETDRRQNMTLNEASALADTYYAESGDNADCCISISLQKEGRI